MSDEQRIAAERFDAAQQQWERMSRIRRLLAVFLRASIERMQASIAALESAIAEAEAVRVELEAEDWMPSPAAAARARAFTAVLPPTPRAIAAAALTTVDPQATETVG